MLEVGASDSLFVHGPALVRALWHRQGHLLNAPSRMGLLAVFARF